MPEFEQILTQLPTEIATVLRQLSNNGRNISPRELLRIIAFLFASGSAYAELITQALVRLVMAGRLSGQTVLVAMRLWGAGEGASIAAGAVGGGAGGGGAAGAGGVAGGITAGAVITAVSAALFMLASIYLAYVWISEEIRKDIDHPTQGVPCTATGGDTTTVRETWSIGIGGKTAANRALKKAVADVAGSVTCGSDCDKPNHLCSPVPIVISVLPKSWLFWSTATVRYMGGCQCLPIPVTATGDPIGGGEEEEGTHTGD